MNDDKQYTILAVDDAKDTLLLLNFDLNTEGYQVIKTTSGEKALDLISNEVVQEDSYGSLTKHHNVDLILLDMYMTGMSGLATLELIKSDPNTCDIPVIMLSASNDEDEIVEALELGADDYVTKPYIAKVLLARIRTSLRLFAKTQQLERLAKTDFLTAISNRANFYDLSTKALSLCRRNQQSLVIAMFDIDFFKHVNDEFGHDVGDLVLVEFAKVLSLSSRDYDFVARIGGEEFAICMPNTSIEDAMLVCERLRKRIENNKINIGHLKQEQLSITVSIGVVAKIFQGDVDQISVDILLKLADQALYHAKENGRNITVNADTLLSKKLTKESFLTNNVNLINKAVDESVPSEVTNSSEYLLADYPGVDVAIGLANVLEDKNIYHEILVIFYQEHFLDGEKLQKALVTGDMISAKHLIHTLKGVSCSIGAMQLFHFSKVLDSAIKDNEQSKFKSLFEQGVLIELNKVLAGIKLQLIDSH